MPEDGSAEIALLVAACLWDCEDHYADVLERWSGSAGEDTLGRPIAAELAEGSAGRIEIIAGGQSYTLWVERKEV